MNGETPHDVHPPTAPPPALGMDKPMTDRQRLLLVLVGGTLFAVLVAVVILTAFASIHSPNIQLPTR